MIENYDIVFGEEKDDDDDDDDTDFEKKMKRGSLLLARGSFIGTRPDLSTPESNDKDEVEVEDVKIPEPVRTNPQPPVAPPRDTPKQNGGTASGSAEKDDHSEGSGTGQDDGSDGENTAPGPFTMEEMMEKILDGAVTEVDEYLATLDPTEASNTKKELLRRIDEVLKTEEFGD